jgi:hypothetical protein
MPNDKIKNELGGLEVLEWNESQKRFHSSTLDECLERGLEEFLKKRPLSWAVVGVFRTPAERDAFRDQICIQRGLEWDGSKYVDVKTESN